MDDFNKLRIGTNTPTSLMFDKVQANDIGVDPSSVECWDAYCGSTHVYHKDKTNDNCLSKYGLLSTYPANNRYLVIDTGPFSSIYPGVIVPVTVDLNSILNRTKLQMRPANTDIWDAVKIYYENTVTCDVDEEYQNIYNGKVFAYSNLDEITLRLSNYAFHYGEDNFNGSNIETINFIQEGTSSHIGSLQRFFRGANSLKNINITWANPDSNYNYLGTGNNIVDCFSSKGLVTFPERLVSWGTGKGNLDANNSIQCSLNSYAFNGASNLVTIPAYPSSTEISNTLVLNYKSQNLFNGCNSLTTVGPILDMRQCDPEDENSTKNIFNGCTNITSIRLKNLNHGDWDFAHHTNELYPSRAYLPKLDDESIKYLINNLYDLTLYDATKHTKGTATSFAEWENFQNLEYVDTTNIIRTQRRYATQAEAVDVVHTTKTFTDMSIQVSGLLEGDSLVFGTADSALVTWTKDDTKVFSKTSTSDMGFKLINNSDVPQSRMVTITIANGYDSTNPKHTAASIYCPKEWTASITNDMITAAEAKGWIIHTETE